MWAIRQRVEMLVQFFERDDPVHGSAVGDDVQVVLREMADPLAAWRDDVRVADLPFPRYDPVEDWSPRRHLVQCQFRQMQALEQRQRLAHTVAGDAAVDRPQRARQAVNLIADHAAGSVRYSMPCASPRSMIRETNSNISPAFTVRRPEPVPGLHPRYSPDSHIRSPRSEERRVGKECRSRWSPEPEKK